MKSNDAETQEWVRHTDRMKALKRERLKLRTKLTYLQEHSPRLQVGWLDNPSPEFLENKKARDKVAATLLENEKQIMAESGYKF